MTRDDAIEKLKEWQGADDQEIAHRAADVILCDLLRGLGYDDVVEEWEEVEKWYA